MDYTKVNFYGDWGIGENTKIGAFSDVGGKIGNNCKVQAGVKIPPLTVIGNNVFIGANVVFTNDKYMDGNMEGVIVEDNVKIGAGSLILAGVKVGKGSILGMGSIILKDVPPNTKVIGLYK